MRRESDRSQAVSRGEIGTPTREGGRSSEHDLGVLLLGALRRSGSGLEHLGRLFATDPLHYASTLRALEPIVGRAVVALLHEQFLNMARWGDAAGRHTPRLFPGRDAPGDSIDRRAGVERGDRRSHTVFPEPLGRHAGPLEAARRDHSPYGESHSPLHPGLRGVAERSLGLSLSHVRVFHGPKAHTFARGQAAAALVWGSDIVLSGAVANAPGPVMAEELAHVAQQHGAQGPRYPQIAAPLTHLGSSVERAARRAAPWVLAGRQARMGSVARRAIMRHEEGGKAPEERNAEDLSPQTGSMQQRSEEELAAIVNDERGVPRYRREGLVYLPERPGAVTLDLWLTALAEQEERKRSPRGKGEPDSGEGYKVGGELYVPVQRKAQGPRGAGGPAQVQRAAARGTSGPGAALPFGARIQRAFGHHDVSGVRAHLGTMASEAALALGATAFARGDSVAFRGAPDLHTAAHEAAHIVQQRHGVALDAGVGREGDVYERHADSVADAVVEGRSAQALLDRGPRGGRRGGVQLRSDLETSNAGARRQYQQLLTQQEHAHGRGTGTQQGRQDQEQFESIFATAADFAAPLRTAIRGIQTQPIPIRGADGDRQQNLVQYMELLARSSPGLRGRSYADVVFENLSSRGAGAQQRARQHLESGGDVFGAFEGRWRGTWVGRSVQNGTVSGGGITASDRVYDHDWQHTQAAGVAGDTLQVQPVEMGEYDPSSPARQAGQGTQSSAPQGAINAVDTSTGRITGGVGIHEGGGANQPCAGYFVDANTLLWVSHENGGQGDLFTVFFEHGTRDEPPKYLIMGVQFHWDGRAVNITQLSGTEYNQAPQQRNGVQKMGRGHCDEDVHDAAEHGTRGAGGTIPHADQLQAAFGAHDVSGIRAHVGGAAAEASGAMGAQAYASGNDVAFAQSPDLHTAAHEAAHVVQQRQGVSLLGGVGQVGDPYENHADAVADAVVRGESAEDLLSAGPSGGDSGVQQRALESPGNAGQGSLEMSVQRQASPYHSRVLQHRAVQRQVLHGSERDAATAEGIPPDGIRNRARLLPLSLSGPPKSQLSSAAFNLRRELLAAADTRGYFVPADPTHTNTRCPGVALMVEAGVLTSPDALLAVASEIIDAYIRVPGSVGSEPARARMTVILHGRNRPISLHHDNLGLEEGETGIILKKAGANGARPTYHEFAHAFAGHSPSGSLSEGLASFVQGEYRPGQADRYFPFAQDPHMAALGSDLWQDSTLVARIGGAGDAPNFHGAQGQSEQARRMWFYRASWSFVHYLVREVHPVQAGGGAQEQSEQQGGGAGRQASASQDPGMQAFMQVYRDPGAYQRVYGQDLATLRSRWRSWVMVTAGVQAGQRARQQQGSPPVQRRARSAVVQRLRDGAVVQRLGDGDEVQRLRDGAVRGRAPVQRQNVPLNEGGAAQSATDKQRAELEAKIQGHLKEIVAAALRVHAEVKATFNDPSKKGYIWFPVRQKSVHIDSVITSIVTNHNARVPEALAKLGPTYASQASTYVLKDAEVRAAMQSAQGYSKAQWDEWAGDKTGTWTGYAPRLQETWEKAKNIRVPAPAGAQATDYAGIWQSAAWFKNGRTQVEKVGFNLTLKTDSNSVGIVLGFDPKTDETSKDASRRMDLSDPKKLATGAHAGFPFDHGSHGQRCIAWVTGSEAFVESLFTVGGKRIKISGGLWSGGKWQYG